MNVSRLLVLLFALSVAGALAEEGRGEAPRLLGHWKFDGDANDAANPPHNGKAVGRAEFSASPVNASDKSRALWLNGIDAFMQIDAAPELNVGAGDFSLSLWLLSLENRRAGILSKGGGPGWALVLNGDGALEFETIKTPAGRIAAGQWFHVAVSIKRGADGNASKIFVNGELAASGNFPPVNLDNTAALLIGNLPGDAAPAPGKKGGLPGVFSGLIDDVRLYKGALSAEEAAKLTDEGMPSIRRKEHTKTPFAGKFELQPGEVVVFTGGENFCAEHETAYLETLLTAFPPLNKGGPGGVQFRNMAWEGDTVYEQWRILNFGPWKRQFERVNASIIITQFGQMESLQGKANLEKFIAAYEKLLDEFSQATQRIVLVPPMPFEKTSAPLPDRFSRNADVKLYAEAIAALAKKRGYLFADIYTPLERSGHPEERLTSNGVHLTSFGQWIVARTLAHALGATPGKMSRDQSSGALQPAELEKLRAQIVAKNKLWYEFWRPGNWAFLAGDRVEQPFSRDFKDNRIRLFPAELQQYQALIQRAELKINELAREVKP